MGKSLTHHEITLRPPPGTRFSVWGQDVRIEFQRGREEEVVNWLRQWIDTQIVPEIARHEQRANHIQRKREEKEGAITRPEGNAITSNVVSPNQVRMGNILTPQDDRDRCGFVYKGKQCQLGSGHIPVAIHAIDGMPITLNPDGTINAVTTKE